MLSKLISESPCFPAPDQLSLALKSAYGYKSIVESYSSYIHDQLARKKLKITIFTKIFQEKRITLLF